MIGESAVPTPAAKRRDTRYTWSDYRSWSDEERWEIIDGIAYAMSPAPSPRHQTVTGNLFGKLLQHLSGKPCRPFIAPTDVRLTETDVVQPDILVVCDAAKITPTHIEGAPDVVVEVLSPTTAAKDLRQKKMLYERSGVREYIVVDPLEHYAVRFLLGPDGFDKGTVYGPDEKLAFATLEGLEVALWEVLELPGPEAIGAASQP
jgi:Uma2 family endonuclease